MGPFSSVARRVGTVLLCDLFRLHLEHGMLTHQAV